MKVKVKKVKRSFIKKAEDEKMTMSQFVREQIASRANGIPTNDDILNVRKELKQCLSDTDIPLLNRSSEWANFIETTDTNCGLIGPLTFESFFDENNDFNINEIGTFIFSDGFDGFIFIEKTLKCMWHFQRVVDDEIILENEFGETYICHDWKTFCTTVLPGVYTMYNITDANIDSEFELSRELNENAK